MQGGVGLYIKKDIEFIRRQDIEFDFEGVETCFIEIPRHKTKILSLDVSTDTP